MSQQATKRILAAVLLAFSLAASAGARSAESMPFDPYEASILELQLAMATGQLTARGLTAYYLARIERFDQRGPALNSMAFINADALAEADQLDSERVISGPRSPLHGIPVVVKDNYETQHMPTTAGSRLLHGFQPDHDAHLEQRRRQSVAGRTSLSD